MKDKNIKEWYNITLKQFIDIQDIFMDAELDEQDKMTYLINAIFGVDIMNLQFTELADYVKRISFVNSQIPKAKCTDTYKINGKDYVMTKNVCKFTTAQYIDYMGYIKNGGADFDNYPNILSLVLIPSSATAYNDGSYDIEEVKSDILNHLSIVDCLAISNFFLAFSKAYQCRFLASSLKATKNKETRKKIRKLRKMILVGD